MSDERQLTEAELAAFETEKRALTGDLGALTYVISAVRIYRQAAKDLLAKRYRDGECDAAALFRFESEAERATETMRADAPQEPKGKP